MAETAWQRALRLRSEGLMAQWAPKATGTKPPVTSWSPADVQASLAANPGATFGPSPGVDYSQAGSAVQTSSSPFAGFAPSITIPGYDPDYASLMAGDPNVVAASGDLAAYQGQLNDARRAAIRRAVIAAGLAPGSALADVDEATRTAAAQNPFSSNAELSRQRERSRGDLGALLASRGMIQSGATQGGESRIQEGYERSSTQLVQQLLDQLAGYEGDFTERLNQVKLEYNRLKEAAALRIQQDPRYQPIGENDAILDPDTGFYMTPDGRWYDSTGKRVGAPVRGQTAPTAVAAAPVAAAAAAPAPLPPPTQAAYESAINQPVYSQVGGQIIQRPQGWIPLPGENLFT